MFEILRQSKHYIKLFLVSFLILFLEVAFIRWISIEINIFTFLSNFVLLACFLGVGLGCYFSMKRISLLITIIALALISLFIRLPLFINWAGKRIHILRDIPSLLALFLVTNPTIKEQGYSITDLYLFAALGILIIIIIFFTILFVFIPLGSAIAQIFNKQKNIILSYSINIFASIIGILFFCLFSFTNSPPWIWFLLISSIILVLVPRRKLNILLGFICLLVIILTMFLPSKNNKIYTIWSPYQKLEVYPFYLEKLQAGYRIVSNNIIDYIYLLNFSDEFVKNFSENFNYDVKKFNHYDLPFMFKKNVKDFLVVGSGGGNDVAGALRNDVKNIEAIEIDPVIYKIGLKLHPEKPYSNPRVKIIIDDGRSFFKRSKNKYDIIVFGYIDAAPQISNYNNIGIDHYLYTEESLQEAKNLLKEDGLLIIKFGVNFPWTHQRIYWLLKKVFYMSPLAFWDYDHPARAGTGHIFVVAKDANIIMNALNGNEELKQYLEKYKTEYPEEVRLTTDDWPYLYLEKPMIPKIHLAVILILLSLFIVIWKGFLARGQKLNIHFFFLGGAFLLLEFQNISKTALLFGSTWLVNAFTISAILILILCANLFVAVFKLKNLKFIYLLLIMSISIIYFIPLRMFNLLNHWPKFFLANTILNLPIFFAGIIFITSFKNAKRRDLAFGSNLLGAAIGGTIESISFITGIRFLLLIVMGFYVLSYIFQER